MYRAEISLVLLKLVGIWPPESSNGSFRIYNVFTIFIVSLTATFATSNLLYLLGGNLDMEEFTDSLFYFLALLVGCVKMAVVLSNRDKIIEITEILLNKQFAPRDFEELCIQGEFDKIGRTGTIIFTTFFMVTVISRSILPLVKGDETYLPYNAWIPYNLESRSSFWLTFTFQSFSAIVASQAIIAGDAFIVVMMLQLCAQIEILTHRIETFPELCKTEFKNKPEEEKVVLGNWIQHHNSLYLFGNKLNDVFGLVFFCQLLATALEVCTSTYLLATFSVTSGKFWSMIFSLGCIMSEIFIFCWHGNMITEKSREIGSIAFSMDWISLSRRSRSSLVHIIKRTNTPIKFTVGSVASLSIDTFSTILRLSYSIYNCLMRPS